MAQVLNARVRVFLNCVEKHSEMPNKSYFRQTINLFYIIASLNMIISFFFFHYKRLHVGLIGK